MQPEPHFVTVLVLSAVEGLFVNYVIDFFVIHLFRTMPSVIWYKLLLVGIFLIINFNYYDRKGNGAAIVNEKPKYFNSHRLTAVIVLVITLFIISLLFWAAEVREHLFHRSQYVNMEFPRRWHHYINESYGKVPLIFLCLFYDIVM